jgi:hypothetical protein
MNEHGHLASSYSAMGQPSIDPELLSRVLAAGFSGVLKDSVAALRHPVTDHLNPCSTIGRHKCSGAHRRVASG